MSSQLAPTLRPLVERARRVLLIRLRSLGDAVLMTPLPRALKAWRPSLHVSVLVEEPFAAVFRHHPAVDEVLCVSGAGVRQRLDCLARLRRARHDVALNLHSGPTAGLLTALSGSPVRVAYARARFAWACNVRVPRSEPFWGEPRVHTVKHQLTPLLHLGIPVPGPVQLELQVDAAASRRVLAEMRRRGLEPGRFIVMQPFSSWATKEWAAERFAQLARRLAGRYGLPIVALPARSEAAKAGRLASLAGDSVAVLDDVALEEMIAWIEQCALLVGNDSGPAHVAAALRKKSVVIFGSADPRVWRPWAGEYQLLTPELPCIPCAGDRCYAYDTPRCIESVSVDEVLAAVGRLEPLRT